MRQSWCSDGQYPYPGCLWPSPALCPGCWPRARTQARPHSAQRTRQPSNTVTVSTAGKLQPDIGAGYHHNRQDVLSYTCPQVTLTLCPVPSIFPAADNKWSYWVRPYSDCYATMSSPPTVRPPRPLCCLLWLCSYLSCFWSTPNTHSQVWLRGYLIHPWSTPTNPSHPSVSCGYLTYPWRMPTMHALLPAVATWLLINPWSTHTTPSQVWLCGYLTHPWSTPTTPTSLPLPAVATWLSRLSLEYAHHAQPGVIMWLSHPSLEYAHHAYLSASASCGYVAISLIPGVRPPRPPLCLCQLWLRGYLTHPWSTPTTPTSLPLPAVATWLSNLSMEYAHHAQPGVAMWLSHPSLKYAHHAHLCLCQLWLSHLSPDHAHHAHPSASCGYVASHQSLEYAHHAQPGVPISPIPGVRPPCPPSASCGFVAISLIPGAYPTRPLFYQLWLCGYATNPWSTPNAPRLAICQVRLCGYLPYPLSTPAAPSLCQRRLRSYLIYPWSTPILLPAAATRLGTWPWNTPTTPSQPQVWWLCGHLTLHQLGFSG